MPFIIGAFPEHLPDESAPVVGRLGDGLLDQPAVVGEGRTDLEYLDALSGDAEGQINQCTKMRWWPPLLDEFSDELLAALQFKFGERHA
jgi:hypothetical protein